MVQLEAFGMSDEQISSAIEISLSFHHFNGTRYLLIRHTKSSTFEPLAVLIVTSSNSDEKSEIDNIKQQNVNTNNTKMQLKFRYAAKA